MLPWTDMQLTRQGAWPRGLVTCTYSIHGENVLCFCLALSGQVPCWSHAEEIHFWPCDISKTFYQHSHCYWESVVSVSSVCLCLYISAKLCKLRLVSARLIQYGQLRSAFSSTCRIKTLFFSFVPVLLVFFLELVPRWAACLSLRGKFQGTDRFAACCFGRRSPLKTNKAFFLQTLFCFQESRCWCCLLVEGGVEWSGGGFMRCLGFPHTQWHCTATCPECEPPSPRDSCTGCSCPVTLSAVASWRTKCICSSISSLEPRKALGFYCWRAELRTASEPSRNVKWMSWTCSSLDKSRDTPMPGSGIGVSQDFWRCCSIEAKS